MSRNKYAGDYRLDRVLDEKGRVRSQTEYIGKHYRFAAPAGEAAAAAKRLIAAALIGWLLMLAILIPPTAVMHLPYFSVPTAFCVLPLFLISETAIRALRAKEPFEHRLADALTSGLKTKTVVFLVLSSLAFAGYLAALILRPTPFGPTDVLCGVCSALLIPCAVFTLVIGKRLAAVALEDGREEP